MEDAMEPNEQGEEERQTEDEAMETVEVEVEPDWGLLYVLHEYT